MTMILSILVGITLALPFKVITKQRAEIVPDESRQELLNRMSKIKDENDQLRAEVAQLRDQISSFEEAMMKREQSSEELIRSRTMYRILAGLEPVQGPGVCVTLSEGDAEIPPGTALRPYLIHHLDLLSIVNELWVAGAEAIGIKSGGRIERLIVDSSIRCVGSLIDVNNTGMTPPFEIYAIGNPDTLYSSLTLRGGVLEPLALYDIETEVVKLDNIVLPAYGGSTLLEYARPLGEE